MRQQSRTGQTAVDRAAWRGFLHDTLASTAAQLRTNLPDDFETSRNVFQYLGDILAQQPQLAAAIGTRLVLRQVRLGLTRQLLG
jgi:hypothetical protein